MFAKFWINGLADISRVALIYVYKAIAHFTAKQKVEKKTMACKYLEIDTRQRR